MHPSPDTYPHHLPQKPKARRRHRGIEGCQQHECCWSHMPSRPLDPRSGEAGASVHDSGGGQGMSEWRGPSPASPAAENTGRGTTYEREEAHDHTEANPRACDG